MRLQCDPIGGANLSKTQNVTIEALLIDKVSGRSSGKVSLTLFNEIRLLPLSRRSCITSWYDDDVTRIPSIWRSEFLFLVSKYKDQM